MTLSEDWRICGVQGENKTCFSLKRKSMMGRCLSLLMGGLWMKETLILERLLTCYQWKKITRKVIFYG